jgi:hypothetical protein
MHNQKTLFVNVIQTPLNVNVIQTPMKLSQLPNKYKVHYTANTATNTKQEYLKLYTNVIGRLSWNELLEKVSIFV